MKCSQARSLFSARLDNELDGATAARVADHVNFCRKCSMHWDSLVATVRMVRGLPEVSPDPSFVGKVLDRVRAYEAGRVELESISESAPGLWSRLKGRVIELSVPVPVRMAGALAIGGVVGLLLAGPDRVIPFGDLAGTVQGHDTRGGVPAQAAVSEVAPGLRSTTQPRPFGDLLDELALSPQANRQDSSESDDVGRPTPARLPSDPMGPSRQVFLDEADGRPQITF